MEVRQSTRTVITRVRTGVKVGWIVTDDSGTVYRTHNQWMAALASECLAKGLIVDVHFTHGWLHRDLTGIVKATEPQTQPQMIQCSWCQATMREGTKRDARESCDSGHVRAGGIDSRLSLWRYVGVRKSEAASNQRGTFRDRCLCEQRGRVPVICKAKYLTVCSRCGTAIRPGHYIEITRGGHWGGEVARHAACQTDEERAIAPWDHEKHAYVSPPKPTADTKEPQP